MVSYNKKNISYQLNIFRNPEELLYSLASAFVRHITKILHTGKKCRVVLGGGRTPVMLNSIIVQICKKNQCDWSGFHIYLSDERMVPMSHPDNTGTMLGETLIAPLGLSDNQIHRIPTTMEAHQSADNYHHELTLLKRNNDDPLFDLALLGLGEDGHTASLFPKSAALNDRQSLAVAAGKGPEGLERVTLTYKAFEKTEQIWFMALGEKKQLAINKLINGPWDPINCPAQAVRPKNATPVLWTNYPPL